MKTANSIFESKSPINSVNKLKSIDKVSPRRFVPPHCGNDQPNLALKRRDNSDYSEAESLNSTQKRKIPFPFLQNLLDSASKDGRYSKKMAFQIEPKKNVQKYNINLTEERYNKDLNDKVDRIMQERRDAKSLSLLLLSDQ